MSLEEVSYQVPLVAPAIEIYLDVLLVDCDHMREDEVVCRVLRVKVGPNLEVLHPVVLREQLLLLFEAHRAHVVRLVRQHGLVLHLLLNAVFLLLVACVLEGLLRHFTGRLRLRVA